jgi:SAM-dependent methyltransferase
MDGNWERFYRYTHDSPPWPLLIRAAELLPDGGRALDLGAGAGRDTRYLLAHGFIVTAVDADVHAVERLRALADERLHVVHSTFEAFPFEPRCYELISAQFALPFVPEPAFSAIFARLVQALRPGGVFAGQFFGPYDQWNTPGRQMTFVSRQRAQELLRGLDVLELREEDTDGHTADGSPKHWHVFHILARKPAP